MVWSRADINEKHKKLLELEKQLAELGKQHERKRKRDADNEAKAKAATQSAAAAAEDDASARRYRRAARRQYVDGRRT